MAYLKGIQEFSSCQEDRTWGGICAEEKHGTGEQGNHSGKGPKTTERIRREDGIMIFNQYF